MVEKRVAPRHRVLKAGTIEFGGGTIDRTVRNVSNTGAALEVASPIGIPVNFTLVIPADGLHFACRVIWAEDDASASCSSERCSRFARTFTGVRRSRLSECFAVLACPSHCF